jgi:hypothetical protein
METARRGFLRTFAAVPLAPVVVGPQATPAPAPAPPPGAVPTPPTGHEAVAEALVEAVKREFGAPVDPTDLAALRKELVRGLESADRLRQAAGLRNSDGPVNLFEARPPAAGGAGARR